MRPQPHFGINHEVFVSFDRLTSARRRAARIVQNAIGILAAIIGIAFACAPTRAADQAGPKEVTRAEYKQDILRHVPTIKREGGRRPAQLAMVADRADIVVPQGQAAMVGSGFPTVYGSRTSPPVNYPFSIRVDTGGNPSFFDSLGDDYATATAAPFFLQQFVFVGGVDNPNEVLIFEFYDTNLNFIEDFAVQFPTAGVFAWTLNVNTPFQLPGNVL